jgi:hypothetical protein
MTPTGTDFAQERVAAVMRLAAVLEHFDSGRLPFNADQYRAVAHQLGAAMKRDIDPTALAAVLDAHPAAAALYENQHYDRAGLARSPIDQSVAAERFAAQVIARAARG